MVASIASTMRLLSWLNLVYDLGRGLSSGTGSSLQSKEPFASIAATLLIRSGLACSCLMIPSRASCSASSELAFFTREAWAAEMRPFFGMLQVRSSAT